MFLKSTKKKLLYRENVCVNCKSQSKEQVIRTIGQMLVNTGYVDESYVEAMLERERTYPTFMGNGLALPHGVEAAKKDVKHSGIAVMTFPEGIDWSGNKVKVVIGVAGVGEEHLRILGIVADKMLDPDAADKIANADAENVYKILSGEE
jgi:mannitol/fructose-specific phosphotransferase system IIA component